MKNYKQLGRERGMTALGWMTILVLIAFFALLAMRVVPMYLAYSTLDTIIQETKKEADGSTMRIKAIEQAIQRRIDINMNENPPKGTLVIKPGKGAVVEVVLDYEPHKPMLGPFGVYAVFKKTVEIHRNASMAVQAP